MVLYRLLLRVCLAPVLLLCIGVRAGLCVDDIQRVDLVTRDIVYDPISQQIYASVPGSAPQDANSIVPIHPLTGEIGRPILVGSEPGKLAVSDDGKYLYVALESSGAIRRVDLESMEPGLQFPVGGGKKYAGAARTPGHRDCLQGWWSRRGFGHCAVCEWSPASKDRKP